MASFFRLFVLAALAFCPRMVAAQGVPGDSLSDNGNIQHVVEDKFVFISFPSLTFDYADGPFTQQPADAPAFAQL